MRTRLFLTCWIVFCLHFATDFVREHYLVVSIAEDATFDLGKYYGLHEDIFKNPENAPEGGVHHGANPGISMLAAIPYAALRPLVDGVVGRVLAGRKAAGADSAVYNDPREARVKFYQQAFARGLDVRFGLVGIITMVLCMAPLSALGVVAVHRVLEGAGVGARPALGLSLLYAFGTPVLFRSAYLNQNLAIGIVAIGAFLMLWNPGSRLRMSESWRTVLAGALAGFGFLCDYSGALALGILGLYALAKARDTHDWSGVIRIGVLYTVGALPMILILWFYQWQAFGHPILPPQHWMPAVIYSDQGYQGVTGPNFALFLQLLFHPSFGLVVSAPLLVLALGAPFLLRGRRSFVPGRELVVCFAITVAYIVFFSAIAYTRLQWSTGIRYLMPVIPFLFLAAAAVLVRMPRALAYGVIVVAVTVAWSMAMVRNQYGVHQNIIRVFVEGFQLPWLTTLGKMAAQYAPWLTERPSPFPVMLLCAAMLYGVWTIERPWRESNATDRR
jgi:MFS family permease